jgi:hypothetical protein
MVFTSGLSDAMIALVKGQTALIKQSAETISIRSGSSILVFEQIDKGSEPVSVPVSF